MRDDRISGCAAFQNSLKMLWFGSRAPLQPEVEVSGAVPRESGTWLSSHGIIFISSTACRSLMAESLSAECTPLKHAYDTCFNAWFEGYLEPATSSNNKQPSDPSSRAKKMAAEYEEKCGKLWEGYRECVQVRCCSQRYAPPCLISRYLTARSKGEGTYGASRTSTGGASTETSSGSGNHREVTSSRLY
ncbi:hypothetical protein AG1IA_00409 [Rhizoctonia solani AG-1 IA]|uniref:Uncharacterized protein n=1 Tax=Thanatephorus cucumeris (strain AG1-IA) TaxID=983506 RepID=L8X5C9_THACA|nr:hypothetical protein AG1IA_00409 [Rhizoctonia solani AG-1 IA]